MNKMQGLQRREALIERPAERAEENQLEMEQAVAQTEVGSNEDGVKICASGAWSDTFLDWRERRVPSPRVYAPTQTRPIRAYPCRRILTRSSRFRAAETQTNEMEVGIEY